MKKFENTKVGDTVYVLEDVTLGWNNAREFFVPKLVTKTTATQITIEGDKKYNRDGRRVGGHGYGDNIFYEGENSFYKGVAIDQTKEMKEFKIKLNKEQLIQRDIESLKIVLDSKLTIEELINLQAKISEIKSILSK
jgi:hypothetical protein